MFGFIEKWALKRLFKRIAEAIPVAQDRLEALWEAHKEEIIEKVTEAIKKTITTILKKLLEKEELTEN